MSRSNQDPFTGTGYRPLMLDRLSRGNKSSKIEMVDLNQADLIRAMLVFVMFNFLN